MKEGMEMLPGGKGCQPRRGERLGVNPTLGNLGNAGGPAHTPQWCQPGPATPGPSGGRKCHTKCHHSGENKPDEMKQFLWGWGEDGLQPSWTQLGSQLRTRGVSFVPTHEAPPRPGSTPHRILETPWGWGHGSTLSQGGTEDGYERVHSGLVWQSVGEGGDMEGDWMDPGCPCPSSLGPQAPCTPQCSHVPSPSIPPVCRGTGTCVLVCCPPCPTVPLAAASLHPRVPRSPSCTTDMGHTRYGPQHPPPGLRHR